MMPHLIGVVRCAKWETSGGKSGSDFRKTLDDRFILKQVRNAETLLAVSSRGVRFPVAVVYSPNAVFSFCACTSR